MSVSDNNSCEDSCMSDNKIWDILKYIDITVITRFARDTPKNSIDKLYNYIYHNTDFECNNVWEYVYKIAILCYKARSNIQSYSCKALNILEQCVINQYKISQLFSDHQLYKIINHEVRRIINMLKKYDSNGTALYILGVI